MALGLKWISSPESAVTQLSTRPTHHMMDKPIDCCPYVSWMIIWGTGVFCMFSDKCVPPALHTPKTIKPKCAPVVVLGPSQDSMLPLSLPCLLQSPPCVRLLCPWVITLLSCLECVHMMCSVNSPCPAHLTEDKMAGP